MTIRTFWTLFLKILGIWLILSGLTVIPQFLNAFYFFGDTQEESIIGILFVVFLLLLTVGIYFLVLKLFVFKTDWIINKLKLDKGFQDEKVDLNVSLSTILSIATIIIGGLIFVDAFPMLCKDIFVFIQHKTVFIEYPEFGWIIFYLVKTIIGYLLMTNSKTVIFYINKQSDKSDNKNGLQQG